MIVVGDVVEDDPFSVVEADVEVPILPINLATGDGERHTLWLSDVEWLEICAESALCLDRCSVIVRRGRFRDGTTNGGDINMNDLLGVGVEDRAEIEGIRILAIVLVRTIVHEGLLETGLATEALIISDGPCLLRSAEFRAWLWGLLTVTVDLVHIGGRYARENTLLNDPRVHSYNVLNGIEVLHGDLVSSAPWFI